MFSFDGIKYIFVQHAFISEHAQHVERNLATSDSRVHEIRQGLLEFVLFEFKATEHLVTLDTVFLCCGRREFSGFFKGDSNVKFVLVPFSQEYTARLCLRFQRPEAKASQPRPRPSERHFLLCYRSQPE